MSDICVGKRSSGPAPSSNPVLSSPLSSADVPPPFAPLSNVDRSVLLSWLHDKQCLLASHGDRLTSLLASTNSHLAAISARIDELQAASSGAPQNGGSASASAPVSGP